MMRLDALLLSCLLSQTPVNEVFTRLETWSTEYGKPTVISLSEVQGVYEIARTAYGTRRESLHYFVPETEEWFDVLSKNIVDEVSSTVYAAFDREVSFLSENDEYVIVHPHPAWKDINRVHSVVSSLLKFDIETELGYAYDAFSVATPSAVDIGGSLFANFSENDVSHMLIYHENSHDDDGRLKPFLQTDIRVLRWDVDLDHESYDFWMRALNQPSSRKFSAAIASDYGRMREQYVTAQMQRGEECDAEQFLERVQNIYGFLQFERDRDLEAQVAILHKNEKVFK
jgi:hypothetical protein